MMAKLYPTIYASVLCVALIFVHTGESLDCGRDARAEATATRKACIQSGVGGCGQAYTRALINHQRTCSFQVGRRSGGLATLIDESQPQDSPVIKQKWTTKEAKFNALMNRLRKVAEDAEDEIPQWLQEQQDAILESQRVVPHDSIQRLLARL